MIPLVIGASTVGAVTGIASGSPNWWQVAFLLALIPGATIAARTAGGWWVRGETRPRYAQLVVASMIAGVAVARLVQLRLGARGPRQDPAYRNLIGN